MSSSLSIGREELMQEEDLRPLDYIHSWNKIRGDLAVRFLFGLAIWLLVPLIPTFILANELGFTAANFTTPLITGLFLTALYFRKKLTTREISIIVVAGMSLIYLISVYTFGVLSSANVWFFPIVLMANVLFGSAIAFMLASFLLAGFSLAAYGFITGWLHLPSEASNYFFSKSVWVMQISFGIIVFGFVLFIVSKMQSTLVNQYNVINEKNIRIAHLANHDPLTGLATLRLAKDRFDLALQMASRSKKNLALLFLDLDSFKLINDRFGHDVGDAVLKEVAIRLQKEIRESDTACRIGGDEFLIILSEVSGKEEVKFLCQRLIDHVTRPILLGEHNHVVGISIGAAIYPDCGETLEELRKRADASMYEVKRGGKNSFSVAS